MFNAEQKKRLLMDLFYDDENGTINLTGIDLTKEDVEIDLSGVKLAKGKKINADCETIDMNRIRLIPCEYGIVVGYLGDNDDVVGFRIIDSDYALKIFLDFLSKNVANKNSKALRVSSEKGNGKFDCLVFVSDADKDFADKNTPEKESHRSFFDEAHHESENTKGE